MVKYKKYSTSHLQSAVSDVAKGIPIKRAAKNHGLSHMTLKRHARKQLKGQPVRVLTAEEEIHLCTYIEYCQKRSLPLNVKMIKMFARSLIIKQSRSSTIGENGPSHKWFRNFLRRHPNLKMQKPQTLDGGRVRMSNETIMSQHFSLLKDTMQSLDGEQGDSKKGGKAAKEKKKKRLTAYTMWCNTVRNKVLSENQGMDFAQLSRRLGEIWQGLPAKAKMAWKRKAKREARKLMGKGLLISTSKGGGGVITTTIPSSQAMSAAAAAAAANTTAHATPTQQATPTAQPAKVATVIREEPSTTKAFGIEPIDVSAHLKLVGESLSIIGMRLQEHRGLIAVQGSLSVLLDSVLCALGPLMCLTSQIPEMNGCSTETHSRTLDNVAFFMPGL